MGVGNHYNMAAWSGKGFGEISDDLHLKEDERKQPRNFILKCLKIDDILSLNKIDNTILEALIKNKPACKLYTGNSIISKSSEDFLKVNDIEALSKHIYYLDSVTGKEKARRIKEVVKFFTLQESRNIGLYYYYNNNIINRIMDKKEISLEDFKKSINYGYLLKNNDFNNKFIKELNDCILISSKDEQYKQRVFALSKSLFNEIYPKIYFEKIKKYEGYTWIIVTIVDNTVGCTDASIIDFSEPWHQYFGNKIFQNLQESDQKSIKSSVIMTLTKNKLLFGFNPSLENNRLFSDIISSQDNIKNWFGRIYSFLNIYMLLCSFDFFTITSESQKKDLFNYLIDNFQTIKKIYEINSPNREKFIS